MASEKKAKLHFAIPTLASEQPIDMSLSDRERCRRSAFYRTIENMKKNNMVIMDCSKCLLIFNDSILHRIHMTMHGGIPSWFYCSMCRRHCSDRRQFLVHSIKYGHSMIPDGVALPPDFPRISGFPAFSQLFPLPPNYI